MASPSPAPVFLRGPQGENNALVHNLTSLCSDFHTSFKASGYTLEEIFSGRMSNTEAQGNLGTLIPAGIHQTEELGSLRRPCCHRP